MAFTRRMRSLPLSHVRPTDSFWTRWHKVLVETTLPKQYEQIVQTGRLKNFERAAGKAEGDFEGLWFNDSDVYKWIEACAYALALHPSPALKAMVDQVIETIAAAQEPDGYLNTFFQVRHPDKKWKNLHMMHEMYCGGHLLEAAAAMAENLGDDRLVVVASRFADHVMSIFGPDGKVGYCGHEEIELALIKLAKVTGAEKYREFARWLVEQRGHRPSPFEAEMHDPESLNIWPGTGHVLTPNDLYVGDYFQDHAPIREHTEVVGHAVRAMYYYIAAADLADTQNDEPLEQALERVWNNLTKRRMYVTGGIGPSASNEGFTGDYDLPNLTAYAETCAAIGLVLWGHRMLEMTGDGAYADIMERALFNGALSGISLSGDHYFYVNPLESRGTHKRTPWFTCACCPPNIARMIGSITNYAFGIDDTALYVHMPVGAEIQTQFAGVPTKVTVEGDYPWSGEFTVKVAPQKPVEFDLYVRIPDWSDEASADLPGAEEEAEYANGYMLFRRTWKPGDTLTVDLEMHPKWVEADPKVRDNLGRAALTNGPLIYAAERHDLGYAPQLFTADTEAEITLESAKMLEGVNVLSIDGLMDIEAFVDDLYAEVGTAETSETTAKLIPYFAWNNRGATDMQVWLRRM